jgi:hypothetical protein
MMDFDGLDPTSDEPFRMDFRLSDARYPAVLVNNTIFTFLQTWDLIGWYTGMPAEPTQQLREQANNIEIPPA